MAMGAVMVLVAVAMLGNYDVRFQNKIAADLPSFLVNPTEGLEETAAAKEALAGLRNAHGIGAESEAPSVALTRCPLNSYRPRHLRRRTRCLTGCRIPLEGNRCRI